MNNDSERLQFAKWVLERNLGWVVAAEVKTGVVVAIDTAMLGALAAAFSALQPTERLAWANLMTTLSAGCLLASVYCAAMAVLPRMNGPKSSLVFFGGIAKHDTSDFQQTFRSSELGFLLDDCLAQIHRNAEIARDKFRWVRVSMIWSFVAIVPWVAALALLVRT